MNTLDEQIFKEIIAFAVRYPKKIAKTIYVRDDHPRIYDHKKQITLVIKEDKKNAIKSRAEVHCGNCEKYLYSIGMDDIAQAFANAKLTACRSCGKHVQIVEMCHGETCWLEVNCQNDNCGITTNMHIPMPSHYSDFSLIERHKNRMTVVNKWNGKSAKTATKKKIQSTEA